MTHLDPQVQHLTVGQLASRSGVNVSTIHFYERKGLIHGWRTEGNQRRFPRDTLRLIAFIRASQQVGIPLAQIHEALATLPENRPPNRKDWERLSAVWHDDLEQRIHQLQQLRDRMTSCIGCGCLSLERCSLVNRNDTYAERHGKASSLIYAPDVD
jgi:MerR family redox-sensitive transcriptional activator SoxR